MSLNIKDPEADRLARELAGLMGETITQTVTVSLRERLRREGGRSPLSLKDEIMEISRRCAALPRRTGSAADDIIGYDERGLPT
ncbi:MAG: type II toxin-antitoxin system VapB family antitoxin [Candidatus Latescibacteria bacterium]|jgi:antitoxin VapB|nr:antitoxin [Gemmatimonadaceae bacterium]MDP6019180.1 type II toxin-antitoxin system VapB family antitoxin [Candidatus Latescibacterota bacterium]MDP7449122.1 type II toxin-antitoxin system VapB family antitoxin [Candidatus Latescibacterota bacterium]HJP33685.1 type II toxin-antitoxin system VapB family antitoxin [Candidatus Latescibacterota bacterium]